MNQAVAAVTGSGGVGGSVFVGVSYIPSVVVWAGLVGWTGGLARATHNLFLFL